MAPSMWFFLLVFHWWPFIQALDVFCGELHIYEQQRFSHLTQVLSRQTTDDLKQCLELCCGIINCDGVTFEGFIAAQPNEPNCALISCPNNDCPMTEHMDESMGVLSVALTRSQQTFVQTSSLVNLSTTTPTSAPSPALILNTHPLAPVWAVGLAIVIAVVCVGLNLSLLSAYICYRRKQSRKQTAQISTGKGPTLHAFNPVI